MVLTKTVILKQVVDEGLPGPEHFDTQETEVPDFAEAEEGSIQVHITAMSADPYLRMRIKSSSSFGNVVPGEAMTGFVVGKVVASKGNSTWSVGDLFGGNLPFSTVQTLSPEQMKSTLLWKLTDIVSEDELTLGLGLLGMPGSTAYGGLIDVLKVKEGETIFVSAASGAVGSLVGMIAKHVYHCTVIGSCGGPEKAALIKEKFGFDHSLDYKDPEVGGSKENLQAALKKVAPDGIDMYFENVGGIHFDAAFASLRQGGRIAVCGGISQYNTSKEAVVGNTLDVMQMVYTCQRIEGFLAQPWLTGQRGSFLKDMAAFLRAGQVVPQETFFEGVEQWGLAFQSLFTGKNVGKVVIRTNAV